MDTSYRYLLSRNISSSSSRILLVWMLNPSTADAEKDDPTISRVCCLAEKEGYGRLLVVNLFALRATKPADLWLHQEPFGCENMKTWECVLQSLIPEKDSISLAWGRAPVSQHKLLKFIPTLTKAKSCLQMWRGPIMTWVKNLDGSPRHPLYISSKTNLVPYNFDEYLEKIFL